MVLVTMAESGGKTVTREDEVQGLEVIETAIDLNVDLSSSASNQLKSILENIQTLRICQHLDVVEVCLGWERNNRYSLYDEKDNQVLYGYEVAQCYTRQCYGSLREFSLVITDNEDNCLLHLHRPLRCSSRCFYACCDLQEMTIGLAPDKSIGKAFERWSCCLPHYDVFDLNDKLLFEMVGSYCHFRCCNVSFQVSNAMGEQSAVIKKNWGGCKEFIGACNDYTISYSDGLSVEDKCLILGAAFLLDFNYFQRHGKCF